MEHKEIIKELIGKKVLLGGKVEDKIKSIVPGKLRKDTWTIKLEDNLLHLFLDKDELKRLSEGKVVDGVSNTVQIKEKETNKNNNKSVKRFIKVENNYYSRAIDAGVKEIFSARRENRNDKSRDAILKSFKKDDYSYTEDDIDRLVAICTRLTDN